MFRGAGMDIKGWDAKDDDEDDDEGCLWCMNDYDEGSGVWNVKGSVS